MFNNVYQNKRVLITGHTGFKGTWLSLWLTRLGAKVSGYSIDIPTNPSMFEQLDVANKIDHNIGDVRDIESLRQVVLRVKPDFIFHLAAQAIVSTSYKDPLGTVSTNVVGTANLLQIIRELPHRCVGVFITSDKCYENVEWLWGYKETDRLGGKDVYSASKGAAEVIFHSFYYSFFQEHRAEKPISSARAGNVIGGGDWAKDRIIVDAIKAWQEGHAVELRCPTATRPWQHVLEPLSGYLALGLSLQDSADFSGESYNFGPKPERPKTVLELIQDVAAHVDLAHKIDNRVKITDNIPFHEAGLLKLNCEKALHDLKWEATLKYSECAEFVGNWYSQFLDGNSNMLEYTLNQIGEYEDLARAQNIKWATA